MRTRSLAVLGLLCVTLASCGGSSTAIPARSQSRSEATATATFAIKIPPKERSASARRPLYVSANTNSIGITLNGKTTVVRLSSGQANCTTNAQTGTLDCTVGIEAVPVGNATFTLATYASVDGSGPALSSATISAKIVAGSANVETVVLNGIPASASISPVGVEPFIEQLSSDDPSSLTIVGAAPQTIIVNLLDASGATIVGKGTPSPIAIAPTTDCTAAVTPQRVSGQPGEFTVAVTTPFTSCHYQVTANGTPVSSNNVEIGAIVAIYVVASSEIIIYDAYGNIITPAGNFPGTPPAQKIAYNPSVPGLYGPGLNGPGLYVAGVDFSNGTTLSTIRVYDLNGLPQSKTTLEPFSGVPVPENGSQAVSIAFDDERSGLLYGVAATGTAPNGSKQFTEFNAGGGNDVSPASNPLASASAALCAACKVTAIAAAPAVVTPARAPPTLYVAYGPEFSEQTGEVIPFDISAQAAGTSFGNSMIGIPSSIAYCNGLVYVAYAGTNVPPTIRFYTAAAPSTGATPAPSAFSGILQPGAIACDADGSGDLYVADTDATLSKFDSLGNPLTLSGANNVTLAAPTDMVVVP